MKGTPMKEIAFGTDGIRGKAGVWPIDAEGARQVGAGLGRYLASAGDDPKAAIGRDTRGEESGSQIG